MLINQTNVPKFIKGTRDIKKVNTLLKFSFFFVHKNYNSFFSYLVIPYYLVIHPIDVIHKRIYSIKTSHHRTTSHGSIFCRIKFEIKEMTY